MRLKRKKNNLYSHYVFSRISDASALIRNFLRNGRVRTQHLGKTQVLETGEESGFGRQKFASEKKDCLEQICAFDLMIISVLKYH